MQDHSQLEVIPESASTPGISPETEPVSACANCQAELHGPYCSQCGEQVIDHHAMALKHFFGHTLIHEFTHVDGGVFQSLRYLITRPGFLSVEYFAGRRKKYLNPLRLLITAVILFGLLAPAGSFWFSVGKVRVSMLPPGPPKGETIEEITSHLDVVGVLKGEEEYFATRKDLKSREATERFRRELEAYSEVLSLLNVVLVAVVLVTLFRKQRPYFVEHLVFALHSAAFLLLFSTVIYLAFGLFFLFPIPNDVRQVGFLVLLVVTWLVEFGYLIHASVRFYYPERYGKKIGWSKSEWKATLAIVLVVIANSIFTTLVYLIGASVALWRL